MAAPSLSQPFAIDLQLAEQLRNREFRNEFFRAEREIDIPYQIKTLRKARGLSQQELADLSGMKQSAISRLENSSHGKWHLDTLVKVAEALDARLSLVIEPYEAAIARYAAEAAAAEKSAVTAKLGERPPTVSSAHDVPTEVWTVGQRAPESSLQDYRGLAHAAR